MAPVKQKGATLVRRAFQEARSEQHPARDTWDKALSDELREDAIKLFEEYVRLRDVKFERARTSSNFIGKPWALTFSDGSEHSYGAVMYLRWEMAESPIIRLVEAKAKLSPLDQKGDAVKAEVYGAVIAPTVQFKLTGGSTSWIVKPSSGPFSENAMDFKPDFPTGLVRSKPTPELRTGGGSPAHKMSLT